MSLLGVAVTATGAERLRARHPQLPLGDLAGSGAALEPGRPLRLLAPDGDALAAGVADPENELVARSGAQPTAAPAAAPTAGRRSTRSTPASSAAHLRRALAMRRRLGLADGVSAYRLVNGEGDGLSGSGRRRLRPVRGRDRALARARSTTRARWRPPRWRCYPRAICPCAAQSRRFASKRRARAPSAPRTRCWARSRRPS